MYICTPGIEIMTDRPSNQPTDRQMRVIKEVTRERENDFRMLGALAFSARENFLSAPGNLFSAPPIFSLLMGCQRICMGRVFRVEKVSYTLGTNGGSNSAAKQLSSARPWRLHFQIVDI